MDLEMKETKMLKLRKRSGLSLVEVLIAIVVITVALGALLNVFSYSLRLTTESSLHSKNLMAAYAQVQRIFFVRDFKALLSSSSGIQQSATVDLVFSGSGPLPSPLTLSRYDVGQDWPLRMYRP